MIRVLVRFELRTMSGEKYAYIYKSIKMPAPPAVGMVMLLDDDFSGEAVERVDYDAVKGEFWAEMEPLKSEDDDVFVQDVAYARAHGWTIEDASI